MILEFLAVMLRKMLNNPQRERKNRKVGFVDMSELSISVQPIRRHNCEE